MVRSHDPRFPPIRVAVDTRALTPETKCGACPGALCCNYVTEALQTPKSRYDFDYLLWQLSHENVQCFKDNDDSWHLLFVSRCRHLQPDNRCGIYERRPQVCRDHSNDFCEMDQPLSKDWKLYFPDDAALDVYCRKRFRSWDRRHSDWAKHGVD